MNDRDRPRSRLQAVRLHAGLRQDRLAAELEALARTRGKARVITAQTVCDWEAGRRLTLDSVKLLCAYWRRSAEDLGLLPSYAPDDTTAGDDGDDAGQEPSDQESPEDESVNRRRFVGQMAALSVGGHLLGGRMWLTEQWSPPPATETPVPGRIGHSDVAYLEGLTRTFRDLDYTYGGGACRDALDAQVGWARRLLGVPATTAVRRRLTIAVADLHNLAGWTAFDLGLKRPARGHFLAAMELAKEGGDKGLVANILYRAGRLDLQHGSAEEALNLFQLGQLAAHDARSSLSVAVLRANEAWAYATLGDHGQAVSSLRQAEDAYARHDPSDTTPSWVRFGPADLDAMAGTVHTELSATDTTYAEPAIENLTTSVAAREADMSRNLAFELTMLATNHLRLGNLDEGATHAVNAVALAEDLRSTRVVERLAPLSAELARHPHSDLAEVNRRIVALAA